MNKLIIKQRLALGIFFTLITINAISAEQKHLVIYGATGQVGSHIMLEALARGHKVTAVTRDLKRIKEKFKIDGPVADNFFPVQSDVTDLDLVNKTISGADVVVVAVGYSGSPDNDPAKTVQNIAANNLIAAARKLGDSAPRIIQFTGTSSLRIGDKYLHEMGPQQESSGLGTKAHANSYGHILALETYLSVSDVEWTVFTASRTGGKSRGVRTGNFQTNLGLLNITVDKSKKFKTFDYIRPLSWEDLGVAIINEIENPQYPKKQFTAHY